MATLLLERGADVDGAGCPMSPLNRACLDANLPLARLLLDHGADVDTVELYAFGHLFDRTHYGDNALLAELLITHGYDPTRTYGSGTPLHNACFIDQLEISDGCLSMKLRLVRLLLEHGADANRPNFNGMTPLDIVWDTQNHPRIDRNYTRMRALLRKHCAIVIRKHVIGPPAEHPSRRIEHQAPLIASFLV